ncbi:hypothetical protein Cni_G01747 [Canna indica]|uniref:Late embryogenesis abundant protein LEA-2 subgroup domain-containing protein n=1 Tax=Canna indica TaxID=4628 RepID=A0AAQ3Q1G1_9LILI|nr:hypothetical protein Cni_G01747 [Canna indica]
MRASPKDPSMANSVAAEQIDDTVPLLPPRPPRRQFLLLCCPCLRCHFSLLSTLALAGAVLATALFLLWPADPDLSIARLRLHHVHLSTSPAIYLNVSISLSLKVRNPNFFSLDYRSLEAAIGYRGRRLGSAMSDGGCVGARQVSYVDAELFLDGIRVIHDIVYLIEDYRKGSIPFETIAEVQGKLRLIFIDIPVQGNFSCSVQVNAQNQTIIRQDCYI